jgi:hypothetical protein
MKLMIRKTIQVDIPSFIHIRLPLPPLKLGGKGIPTRINLGIAIIRGCACASITRITPRRD